MSIFELLSIVAAVVFGNGLSLFFFMAAMQASKLQKGGMPSDQLPLWVWLGLAAAPSVAAVGVYFTSA